MKNYILISNHNNGQIWDVTYRNFYLKKYLSVQVDCIMSWLFRKIIQFFSVLSYIYVGGSFFRSGCDMITFHKQKMEHFLLN